MIDHDVPVDITDFLADLQRQEVAEKTITSYRADVLGFARWFTDTNGEAFAAPRVTPTDVRDYRAHLRTSQRRAPATVNRRLAALRHFFAWAKAAGRAHELPTAGVKGIPGTPRSPKSLTKRELDRLLRAAEQEGHKRNLAILLTLRHAGLRVGELCHLRLGDLAISERKGSLIVRSGKGDKDRTIPLNNDVRQALSAYLAVRPAIADDHVFIGQRGQPLQTDAVELIVRKYARRAGLPGVTPHTLRHSFGKGLLDAGTDLVTVSRLLGHERLETTAIYTQPTPGTWRLPSPAWSATPAGSEPCTTCPRPGARRRSGASGCCARCAGREVRPALILALVPTDCQISDRVHFSASTGLCLER